MRLVVAEPFLTNELPSPAGFMAMPHDYSFPPSIAMTSFDMSYNAYGGRR
jgi:hypothetical protein